jgi:hypothetical protein
MSWRPSCRARRLGLLLALCGLAAPALASAGVDVWTRHGPEGGHVRALAVTPSAVYAATDAGGLFKSTDGGATWSPANGGLNSDRIYAIASTAAQAGTPRTWASAPSAAGRCSPRRSTR